MKMHIQKDPNRKTDMKFTIMELDFSQISKFVRIDRKFLEFGNNWTIFTGLEVKMPLVYIYYSVFALTGTDRKLSLSALSIGAGWMSNGSM